MRTPAPFARRHIGPDDAQQRRMLESLGYADVDELLGAAVPKGILDRVGTTAPGDPGEDWTGWGRSEEQVLAELRDLASRNRVVPSMIGMGYYGTTTPAVLRRMILENPAWYTAYTPYQPEISQGRLEALLVFQTMVADLTGLPVAGASLLDEATAAAEAMTLCRRVTREERRVFLVDRDIHPQVLAVLRTRAEPLGLDLDVRDLSSGWPEADSGAEAWGQDGAPFGVLVAYPASRGALIDHAPLVRAAHAAGAQVVVAADLLALTLLRPPGEVGADVVVGSSQRFGVPMWFGGPHAGYIAVRHGLERQLPGRLVGVSRDAGGAPAYRLALQTREQHIRRERATSNICTAQVLLAVVSAMYAVYHGPEGLSAIAERTAGLAAALAQALQDGGRKVVGRDFFDTVSVRVPGQAAEVVAKAGALGVNLRLADPDTVCISTDETTTGEQLRLVLAAFGISPAPDTSLGDDSPGLPAPAIPEALRRRSPFLTHPTFSGYRSETAMLRYLRRLADKDYALDRGMIPLGSCTMKLNAAAEMEAISWPEFADIHPFAPADQTEGYRLLIAQLESRLASLTGYDAVSVQPNAGSQGELAGLLAIRAFHRDRGEGHRDVCLIPSSAHGTNAASAVMAGLRVAVVACRDDGEVDEDDLRAQLERHRDRVAAVMLTYPSTNGVYEEGVAAICAAVHEAGGQVYVDGANLNALVGVARPGRFGADVSHLNLHKTFCIPHGGGGPGVGPVAVRAHLAPYLPGRDLGSTAATLPDAGSRAPARVGPVSAAPYGSAGVLPISWAYLRLMGPDGLAEATRVAVLSANYVARRLAAYFPLLFSGRDGLVAHECILDLRPITRRTGVSVEDVAKRLMDYGFHAPTVSFPVPGTLMIEPTESEDLPELDRFCAAMIAIAGEIGELGDSGLAIGGSPLRNAPHPAALLAGPWEFGYDRATAAFPAGVDPGAKYWPPVRRIDGAYGDRNLMCSCPPVSAYTEAAQQAGPSRDG